MNFNELMGKVPNNGEVNLTKEQAKVFQDALSTGKLATVTGHLAVSESLDKGKKPSFIERTSVHTNLVIQKLILELLMVGTMPDMKYKDQSNLVSGIQCIAVTTLYALNICDHRLPMKFLTDPRLTNIIVLHSQNISVQNGVMGFYDEAEELFAEAICQLLLDYGIAHERKNAKK